ncbi:MAG: FAD-binding oxidoreductase [bacterium]|nr:FAD-binding oxidoreductase [bacterium]
MKEIHADVTIVGTGLAGLWTAKELLDNGYTVNLVEKGKRLAGGATTHNEGWLHAGGYHAAIIDDEDTAGRITEKVQYGHRAIVQFAPESIHHCETYALLGQGSMALRAIGRWENMGVHFQKVLNASDLRVAEGIDTRREVGVYYVEDRSVNTKVLCEKLASYIIERGGRIFTLAQIEPTATRRANLIINGKRELTLQSDQFVITAGSGIKDLSKQVKGESINMRFFKAHLLIFPRVTQHNYFSLDSYGVNFMNHGDASIGGLNLDSTEVSEPNCDVVIGKEKQMYDAVSQLAPRVRAFEYSIRALACIKPGVQRDGTPNRPGVDGEIFEISDGYVCALPGKMTEAPHLAKNIVAYIGLHTRRVLSSLRTANRTENLHIPEINSRPIDIWLEQWNRNEKKPHSVSNN